MTAARRRRKPGLRGLAGALTAAGAAGWLLCAAPLGAATTEFVVTDRHTGVAISGFDPVAYFTDKAARLGKSDFEYRYAGAVWRFCNEGNLAAFIADPDVYMPRFGGHDPFDVARGVAVAGDPRYWLLVGERLYLFAKRAARDAFTRDSEQLIATADSNWPAVQLTLSP